MRLPVVAIALLVAGCGSAPPPPPPAPPPAPPPPPPAARITTTYERGISVLVTLGGRPYDGPATLVVDGAGVVPLNCSGGEIAFDPDLRRKLEKGRSFTIEVAGQSAAMTALSTANPFLCAKSIDALRGLDACKNPLSANAVPPPACDADGQVAWTAERAKKDAAFEACFGKFDGPTVASLGSLSSDMRHHACAKLAETAGPEPTTEFAERYVDECPDRVTPDAAKRIRVAARMRTIDEDYDVAKASLDGDDPSPAARFLGTYAITEDPRLDELRSLAKKKRPAKDAQLLAKTRQAVAAVHSDAFSAKVCGIANTTVVIAAVAKPFVGTPPMHGIGPNGGLRFLIEPGDLDAPTCGAPASTAIGGGRPGNFDHYNRPSAFDVFSRDVDAAVVSMTRRKPRVVEGKCPDRLRPFYQEEKVTPRPKP